MSPARFVRAVIDPLYRADLLEPCGTVDVLLAWAHRPIARRALLLAVLRRWFAPRR